MFNFGLTTFDNILTTKKKWKRSAVRKGQEIDLALLQIISMILITKREWEGLPEELQQRNSIIEFIPFYYGQAVLLKRDDVFYFLPCYFSNRINIYGEPTEVNAYGLNGKDFGKVYIRDDLGLDLKIKHKQDAVLFRNNIFATPTMSLIRPYIERLVYIWKSLGIQEGLNRIKLIIFANESVSPKIRQNIEAILDSDDVANVVDVDLQNSIMESVQTTDFGATFNPQATWFDFDKTFNQLLTFVGITNNIETNKMERQTLREVSSGDYLTEYSDRIYTKSRDIFIADVKRIFGLNLKYTDYAQEKVKQEQLEMANAYTSSTNSFTEPQQEGGGGISKEQK